MNPPVNHSSLISPPPPSWRRPFRCQSTHPLSCASVLSTSLVTSWGLPRPPSLQVSAAGLLQTTLCPNMPGQLLDAGHRRLRPHIQTRLARTWLATPRPRPAHCSGQVRTRRTGDESYVYAALLGAAAVDSAADCLLIAVNHSSLMSPPPTDSTGWTTLCLKLINRCILSYWRHSDNAQLTHDGSFTHSSLSNRLDNGLGKRPTLIIPTVILDK